MIEKAKRIRDEADARLNALSEWDKQAANLKKVRDVHDSLLVSLLESPTELDHLPYQTLSDQLTLSVAAIAGLPSIPCPPSSTGPIFGTAATGTAYMVTDYVNFAVETLPNTRGIHEWGARTKSRLRELSNASSRREDSRKRLALISQELVQLYDCAVDTTTKCTATLRTASDAAKDQRRVLERFKGEMKSRCKGQARPAKHYELISKELAANTPLTKKAVADGQQVYDRLHDEELTPIMKNEKGATSHHMIILLEEIDRHVLTVTDALAPTLSGIWF